LRERWFGATGQKVPQLALEGSIDFPLGTEHGQPLVLDQLDDKALRKAHDDGTPVVVRAGSEQEVLAALARPEVACVLVTDPKLLEIDLVEATFGS
jgi:hypothetical protein